MNTLASSGLAVKSALFLFILLFLSSICFSYDFEGGTGQPNNPYQIATAEQLLSIGSDPNLLNKCYILLNDIDLDPNVTGISPFTQAPIAPDTNPSLPGFQGTKFTGIFDGNDKRIINLIIDTAGAGNDWLGLFGWIDGSAVKIKNLGTDNSVITGGTYSYFIGGLCGENYNGTLSNCYSSTQITGGTDSDYLGGLCGANSGTISNCYAIGSITCGDYSGSIGGLCGVNVGMIFNCYSSGQVTGGTDSRFLGGLCGLNNSGMLSNCYSSGQVAGGTDSHSLGGLCGRNYGIISNCYSSGFVSGDQYKGGFCGYNNSGSFTGCFWDVNVSDINDGVGNLDPDPNGVYGRTTDQMQTLTTFTDYDWDFVGESNNGTEDFWRMCVNGVSYPKLFWEFIAGDLLCPDGVDFLDFAFFATFWLNSDCASLNDCSQTDFDLSGSVDANDLDIFTSHWLQN